MFCQTFHRKDDNWKLSRGVSVFLIIGLLLLLSAISAVIIIVKPWTVSKACYNALVLYYLLASMLIWVPV